jgi:hypothetical protein
MRDYYLHPRYDRDHGMRGGVSNPHDYGNGDDFELEIGNNANASPEMIAICCLQDEILEFLEVTPSALGDVLLTMYHQKVAEIEQRYDENSKTRDDGEKLKAFKEKYHE